MEDHTYKFESHNYDCGSHYCTGHTDTKYICACGWTVADIKQYNQHLLDVTFRVIGILVGRASEE